MGKKFFKGALFGGLVGVGLMWLKHTKRGQELRAKMLEHAHHVSKEVLKRIPENDWVDAAKVERVLNDVMKEYGETKQLAGAAKNLVVKEVKKQIKNYRKK
ncbi:MAG TPA: hypothetical protein DDW36_00880 [Candidatus Magasanikbacteria bacterium]|nr:hypothetical protein [Candidatus Magasanikbacteria bacterium]